MSCSDIPIAISIYYFNKSIRQAEKREEAERAAAQAAASKIAGAFGKGSQMGSKGTAAAGAGVQGSADGNSGAGKTSGIGGYGTFDLNGRSLGEGGLPVPVYNVQDEGRVVVHSGESGRTGHRHQHQQADQYGKSCLAACGRGSGKKSPLQRCRRSGQPERHDYLLF